MSIQVVSSSVVESAAPVNSGLAPKHSEKETKSASTEETQKGENLEASDASEDLEDSSVDESESQDEQETKDEEEASQDGDKKPKHKSGFKKRIDKLNRRLSEKDQELEYWKQQAIKGKSETQETKPNQAQEKPSAMEGEPQEDSYDTHKDYLKAVVKWELKQEEQAKEAKRRESEIKSAEQKRIDSFNEKLEKFAETTDDFFDVLDTVPLAPIHVQEAIRSSDMPGEVLYELCKNPSELKRLSELTFAQAAKEIGKIEARLAKESDSSNTNETKTTKAPAPIKPVGSGSGKTFKSLHDPSLSQSEYERIRQAQMAKNGY